jgi:hypothetical protein
MMADGNTSALAAIAPYLAITATVIVWALTQRANRKHEIFKERLKRRVDLFDSLLPEIANFVTSLKRMEEPSRKADATAACLKAFELLGDYRVKIHLYGTEEEQRRYEEFIGAIDKRDVKIFSEKNNSLADLMIKNLRAELDIS